MKYSRVSNRIPICNRRIWSCVNAAYICVHTEKGRWHHHQEIRAFWKHEFSVIEEASSPPDTTVGLSVAIVSLLSLFKNKIKLGLWDHLAVCVSVNSLQINFRIPEPVFTKHGLYITAPEPISKAHFINPSHQSMCLYVYPAIFARQRLGKNITAAMNTHTIEQLFYAPFSIRTVSYQRKVGI
jgi:hypothetical protein